MRLKICEWIQRCWLQAGGQNHSMRFYVHDYASNEDFCLLRGRVATPEEIEEDLKAR